MQPLDKLEILIKNAKRVIWPATQNASINKLVFELTEHVKQLYCEMEELRNVIKEQEYKATSEAPEGGLESKEEKPKRKRKVSKSKKKGG